MTFVQHGENGRAAFRPTSIACRSLPSAVSSQRIQNELRTSDTSVWLLEVPVFCLCEGSDRMDDWGFEFFSRQGQGFASRQCAERVWGPMNEGCSWGCSGRIAQLTFLFSLVRLAMHGATPALHHAPSLSRSSLRIP
jgi:hypothetical protein